MDWKVVSRDLRVSGELERPVTHDASLGPLAALSRCPRSVGLPLPSGWTRASAGCQLSAPNRMIKLRRSPPCQSLRRRRAELCAMFQWVGMMPNSSLFRPLRHATGANFVPRASLVLDEMATYLSCHRQRNMLVRRGQTTVRQCWSRRWAWADRASESFLALVELPGACPLCSP